MSDEIKCCCNCINYVDALCIVTEKFDNEDPETFNCKDWEAENDCD